MRKKIRALALAAAATVTMTGAAVGLGGSGAGAAGPRTNPCWGVQTGWNQGWAYDLYTHPDGYDYHWNQGWLYVWDQGTPYQVYWPNWAGFGGNC